MKIHTLISVCTSRDAQNWSLIAPSIIKYINVENYLLIVPASDISLFSQISPKTFSILNEDLFLERGIKDLIIEKLGSQTDKYGWYLQQLLKLQASLCVPHDRIGLIWDSDTLPIRKIEFNNPVISCFTSNEYNQPYFESIYSLLQIRKQSHYSFISQCMPFYGEWITSLKKSIELKHQENWQKAIINTSCKPACSGFSEYELIGNYALSFYPEQINVRKGSQNWLRHGNSYFGSIKNVLVLKFILRFFFYFISFESWEPAFVGYKKLFSKLFPMRRL